MNVKAHGVLRPKVPAGSREISEVTWVTDLIALLGFAAGGVWMVLVNGVVADGDYAMNMANRANGRTGMGAVMGSKNLKAAVVRGASKKMSLAHPDKVQVMAKWGGSEIPASAT